MDAENIKSLDTAAVRDALAAELAELIDAQTVEIRAAERLSGGAIQENWGVDAQIVGGKYTGEQRWVLRTDAPSGVGVSMGREQEYAVLQRVFAAGVKAPEPLLAVDHSEALGRPYFLMQRVAGSAAGHKLTRVEYSPDASQHLLADLAHSLARLHSVSPEEAQLGFLPIPEGEPAAVAIAEYRAYLDTLEEPQPVLEWGLRWCELNKPRALPTCLIHRDFRTGNYMVHDNRLSGILDWEFTGFGDPREDIGWFSARCWRFAAPQREAGGIGSLEGFLQAYQQAGGHPVELEDIPYWQVMAHLRWGIIALQQAQRHLSGEEVSLELALTGRLLPDLEIEILNLTREGCR